MISTVESSPCDPRAKCTRVLRQISAQVARLTVPPVGCAVAVAGALVGFVQLYKLAAFLMMATIKYLFKLESVETMFTQNFIIVAGWIGIFAALWLEPRQSVTDNLFLLGVVPLCYNFIKLLLCSVSSLHWSQVLTLDGWMGQLKVPTLLLMVTENFAVADLCVGMLILVHFRAHSWWNWLSSKLFLTFILLSTFMVCPFGLSVYLVCMTLLRRDRILILAVGAVGVAVWVASAHSFEPTVMFRYIAPVAAGWVGLALWLSNRSLQDVAYALVCAAIALPAFNYISVLFRYQLLNPHAPKTDFFTVGGWMALMQDPFILFGAVAHLAVANLAMGLLMTAHFHDHYTCSGKLKGTLFLLPILLITSVASPVGLLLYILSVWFVLPRYLRNPAPVIEILDARPVHWGEAFPEFVRNVFYTVKAIIGVLCALASLLVYVLFVVFCYVYSKCGPTWQRAKLDNPTFQQFPRPSLLIPAFVRNSAGQMRVHLFSVPMTQRGWWWSLKFYVLQLAAIVEIAPNANNPSSLSAALAQEFGGVVPAGDGIGIGDRDKVIEYLRDPNCQKQARSLAGVVSTTQAKFCSVSTITLGLAPSTDGKTVEKARKVLAAWIREFDMNSDHCPTFDALTAQFPRMHNGQLPDDQLLYGVFGDVLYWMATPNKQARNRHPSSSSSSSSSSADAAGSGRPSSHGRLLRQDKYAYVELVNNLFQFFPDWVNFMLLGGFMERKVNDALYTMRQALFRDKGFAYEAAMAKSREVRMPESEALRLIVSVLAIAGAAVPAKLAAAVLKRITSNPGPMIALYKKDPTLFIKECARLDPAVFWVNFITSKEESINGVTIPSGTPAHCYIPFANLDPREFGPNPLTFDPERRELGQIMTWNGMEAELSQYPRGCPGHDVSIRALQLVVDHYLPQISCQANNAAASHRITPHLDFITKVVVSVTTMRSQNWKQHGGYNMDKFVKRDLNVRAFHPFRLPTFDEDFVNKLTPLFDFGAQCLTLLPIHDAVWTTPDDDAQSWRQDLLPHFPTPGVRYDDLEPNSDGMVSRLAFFGLACHRTKLAVGDDARRGKYVNDTTVLGAHAVRDGFMRYGAKVCFNDQFELTAIYVSNSKMWVRPEAASTGTRQQWEHAKWIWKVSMFTLVTLHDHLLECHLVKAAALVKSSREKLPEDHILRIFLKPFTFHTIYTNQLAGRTLFCENGLAERVWAFRDLPKLLIDLAEAYTFDLQFYSLSNVAEESYPLHSDYTRLLRIITQYVRDTVGLLVEGQAEVAEFHAALNTELRIKPVHQLGQFNEENLIVLLSHLIMNGTGIHEHVGSIADYQILPSLTGAKIVEHMLGEPTQSYALNTALTASTGVQQPMLLDDWSYIFDNISPPQDRQRIRSIYDAFKASLIQLSVNIRARNPTRFPYLNLDPRILRTSVSK